MANKTSYTELRDHLSARLDQVSDDHEVLIVERRGGRDVALIAADELASLMETAHLLRSPLNSDRLMEALGQAVKGKGVTALTLNPARAQEELRRSVDLSVELKSKRIRSKASLAQGAPSRAQGAQSSEESDEE